MRYVIIDLEATCWEHTRSSEEMEIIEIGAVHLASAGGPETDEFACFVRPLVHPTLSDFCQKLTSIRPSQVEKAELFPAVLADFLDWIGPEPFVLCSWGDFDLLQLQTDCERHQIPFPQVFERHLNLKKEFARVFGVRSRGLKEALSQAGLHFVGKQHRGIDDARNIARLAVFILPQLEAGGLVPPSVS
ncbi:MAG: exonuclease domain-containing protein [Blastocatellia bacterium]|nr:exonuclease domain-containing protein [Blastocatellia bacterium]